MTPPNQVQSTNSEPGRPRPRVPTLTKAKEDFADECTPEATNTITPDHYWVAWMYTWMGIAISGGMFGSAVGIIDVLNEPGLVIAGGVSAQSSRALLACRSS